MIQARAPIGLGKTYAQQRLVEELRAQGHAIVVIAPDGNWAKLAPRKVNR